MLEKIKNGVQIAKNEGLVVFFISFLWFFHSRTLRKVLPTKIKGESFENGKIADMKLGDAYFGGLAPPHNETQYSDYIRQYTSKGDTIVIVGAYLGTSSAIAMSAVGESGRVITVEPTTKGIDNVQTLAKINNFDERVETKQGKIGEVHFEKHNEDYDKKDNITKIPECDILAIDCDGCEFNLLNRLNIRPKKIIVEHHGEGPKNNELSFEYDKDELLRLLNDKGYQIVDYTVEERTRGGIPDKEGHFVAERNTG